jgi:hypothetical protein
MRRSLRTVPAILVGALALVTTTTRVPPIAGAASATSVAAAKHTPPSSDDQGVGLLQVTPVGTAPTSNAAPRVVVAVDPGASTRGSFVVVNRSADLVLTVGFAAVDATAVPGGALRYAASSPAGSPATWLTLSDLIATLEPGAKLPVSLTITPPANAAPATVIAAVVVRVHSAVRAADQTAVHANATVTVPVAITVKGAPTAVISITGVRMVDTHGRTALEITFQNGGATANTMAGRVQIRGPRPYTETLRASVAPLTQTTVRVPFAMPSDATTVPISVVATDAGGDQATWTGAVGADTPSPSAAPTNGPRAPLPHRTTTRTGAASLPRLGLIVVACVFVAAAIWFGAELRRNRRVRRARKRQAFTAVSAASGAADTAVAVPVGAEDPMGAVAAQLGALVDAIDRLVGRLGPPSAPLTGHAPAAPAPTSTDADSRGSPRTGAAPGIPPASADDLYDWPTEAQLDAFAARRRAAPSDAP